MKEDQNGISTGRKVIGGLYLQRNLSLLGR